MIVAAMRPATQESEMKAQPRLWGNHRATAASTASMPTPAAARGESASTPERPASIQDVSYADAPLVHTFCRSKDALQTSKLGSLRLLHQNAQ
ncbi:hypothetical protein J6590_085307 [Homalodisca vitripennis]|nr:hypothetical protein J6590_087195 [Homalodisca vitripennis]KAG8309456.1 hypothetical protein J6590_085307 [Homalodisca vitripennis]